MIGTRVPVERRTSSSGGIGIGTTVGSYCSVVCLIHFWGWLMAVGWLLLLVLLVPHSQPPLPD